MNLFFPVLNYILGLFLVLLLSLVPGIGLEVYNVAPTDGAHEELALKITLWGKFYFPTVVVLWSIFFFKVLYKRSFEG